MRYSHFNPERDVFAKDITEIWVKINKIRRLEGRDFNSIDCFLWQFILFLSGYLECRQCSTRFGVAVSRYLLTPGSASYTA